MSTITAPMLPVGGSYTPGLLPTPEPSPQPADNRFISSRRKHTALAILSAFTAMLLFAGLAFHGYVAWIIAHPYVAPLTSNPMLAKGLNYTDVSFPSRSGKTTVHGWYIPASESGGPKPGRAIETAGTNPAQQTAATAALAANPSKRTVVFSHGYGANREETWVPMYELAGLLHRLQYNVLMFDYGYASTEDRSPATGGLEESKQLLAAVDYASSQGAEELIVWGFSMGAGTALQAALQTDQIDAMILDSLFLPSPESLFSNVRQHLDLPRYPSLPLIEWMLPFWTGTTFNNIPSKQVLETAYSIPTFIMHGTEDAKAPVETAKHIASGQFNPLSREWIVDGGKHELLFQSHPKEYIQRAALFLSQVDAARKSDI
ncbi:alpha/beta hydrolase [Paenibacillus mendelii]|uniref:Alpha/beta hydrolase n=1 Tax=Paenibacillus mendelii TaxID=206163 RepID=A0ABV6JD80_9BACL|nr:alpha/beta fold hydrolase [Paenibacillus mendelii]MCQ6562539.1 alpha/beta hydrolase [Paenibacillus mendelii]